MSTAPKTKKPAASPAAPVATAPSGDKKPALRAGKPVAKSAKKPSGTPSPAGKAVAAPAGKTMAKASTKPAGPKAAPAKPAARKSAGAAGAVKTQKVGRAEKIEKAEKAEKARKPKMVRDSFTIPKTEYVVLDQLKQRASKLARPAKKSEVLRAGIKALAAMADAEFVAALGSVPAIKTGRPALEK